MKTLAVCFIWINSWVKLVKHTLHEMDDQVAALSLEVHPLHSEFPKAHQECPWQPVGPCWESGCGVNIDLQRSGGYIIHIYSYICIYIYIITLKKTELLQEQNVPKVGQS